VAANSEDFVILACTVLIGLKGVTAGQTDTSAKQCTLLRVKIVTAIVLFRGTSG